MSDIQKVIAQMRQYVHKGDDGHECRASGHTLTTWANTLERYEQQTSQGPIGEASSDESGVQSAAHIEAVARQAWETFCTFRSVGGKIDTVARFEGYAVKISIKETQHEDTKSST